MTSHQKEKFSDLLSDPSKKVMFTGSAGCGKTYSISKFLESLGPLDTVYLTSTTHQSLSVLSEMLPDKHDCEIKMSTIHKFLRFIMKYQQDGSTRLFKRPLKNGEEEPTCDYLIIDEVSMLTPEILNDLSSKATSKRISTKIILVGDPVQLEVSSFIDFSSINSYELTVNMRQNEESDLYKYCKKLRTAIETNMPPVPLPKTANDIELVSDHREFIRKYKKSSNDKVILAYQNSTVSSYNSNIKRLLQGESLYTVGDQIILSEPHMLSGKVIFNNRERIEITKILPNGSYPITVNEKAEFNYYSFEVKNNKGKESIIRVPRTKTDHNKYLEFKKSQALKDKSKWQYYYRTMESFNYVHHGFAMTVHSAQGSSVDEVYIDAGDFSPPNDPIFHTLKKLIYVALTRARIKAIVFTGNERDFKEFGRKN